MLMCMSQCPQSYSVWYKNTISCLSRHISTWQWPFLRTSCPGIYTVECWGEMSTVYVLPELDLPQQQQQQRHVNINLMLHKLLPSWKVFMETLLLPACRILTGKSSSCTELQSWSRVVSCIKIPTVGWLYCGHKMTVAVQRRLWDGVDTV